MQTEIRLYLNKMKTKLVETKNDTKTRQNLIDSPFWSCYYMIFCHFQKQKQITNSCAKSQSAFLFGMFLLSFQVMKIYPEKFITLTSFYLVILKSVKDESFWPLSYWIKDSVKEIFCRTQPAFAPFVNFNFTLITILKMRLFCHGDQAGMGVLSSNSDIFRWHGSVFNVTSNLEILDFLNVMYEERPWT